MRFTGTTNFPQFGFYQAGPGEALYVDQSYAGGASYVYAPSGAHLVLEAPLSDIQVSPNGYGSQNLVLTFENGSSLSFWHAADMSGNRGPAAPNSVTIDLMPFYGIQETVYVDLDYGNWETFLGTAGNDNFEDLIYASTGLDVWDLGMPTIQLGQGGDDDMAGWAREGSIQFGGTGSDFTDSGSGRELVYGGAGDDIISLENYGNFDYLISGNSGDDTYIARFGIESLANRQWDQASSTYVITTSTKLTPIYDSAGVDALWLDSNLPGYGGQLAGWSRDPSVVGNDVWNRFEIVGANLEIATQLTQEARDGGLDILWGEQLDWWFKETPWYSNEEQGWKYGMTEAERYALNPDDPTTFPGWTELSIPAQEWLEPRLNPEYWEGKSTTFQTFLQDLNNRYWRVYEWTGNEGERTGAARVQPRFENGINLAEAAKANVAFAEEDPSTYPVFEFSTLLSEFVDLSGYGQADLHALQSGVSLINYAAASEESVEYVMHGLPAYRQYVIDNDLLSDPIGDKFAEFYRQGAVSVIDAATQAIDYAIAQGWVKIIKASQTGVADDDTDTLLVAGFRTVDGAVWNEIMQLNALQRVTANATLVAGEAGDDVLYSRLSGETVMLGREGDNWFELQGGTVFAAGGAGEDTFVIQDHGNALTADIMGGGGAGTDDRLYVAQNFEDVKLELSAPGTGAGTLSWGAASTVSFSGIESIQFNDWLISDTSTPVYPRPPYEVIETTGDFFYGSEGAEKVTAIGGPAQKIYTLGGDDWVIFNGNDAIGRSLIDTGDGSDIIDVRALGGQIELSTGTGQDKILVDSEIVSIQLNSVTGATFTNYFEVALADGSSFLYEWETGHNDIIALVEPDGKERTILDIGSSLSSYTNSTDTIYLTSGSTVLAFDGNDTITGSAERDHIDAGAGNDTINASAGDDYLAGGLGDDKYIFTGDRNLHGLNVIQEGVEGGADKIIFDNNFWFGAGGSPDLPFDRPFERRIYMDDGDLVLATVKDDGFEAGARIQGFSSGATVEWIEINGIERRLDFDGVVSDVNNTQSTLLVADKARAGLDGSIVLAGGAGHDLILGTGAPLDSTRDDYTFDVLYGHGGNDTFYARHGRNVSVGGEGSDRFVINDQIGISFVIGDEATSGTLFEDLKSGGGTNTTNDASSMDVVQIGWSWEDSVFESIGAKGQRIYKKNADGSKIDNQFVEIYDVEQVDFWTGNDFDSRSLLVPKEVDLSEVNYVSEKVRFEFGGATKETIEVYKVDVNGTETRIWDGDRTAVSKFKFADQNVEVVQKLSSGLSDADPGALVYDAGVNDTATQIIYGTRHGDTINARGGNDFILGGDGDDVIVGGAGNDVILGGAGADTLSGGLSDEQIQLGEVLSGSDNDLIIGGDGLDQIKSGGGANFVASGRVLSANEVDLKLIHDKWGQELFNDDSWI